MLQALRSTPGAWRPLAALAVGVLALHAALLLSWSGTVAPLLGLAVRGPLRPVVQLLPREDNGLMRLPAGDPGHGLPDSPPAAGASTRVGAAASAHHKESAQAPALPGQPMGPGLGHVAPRPAALPRDVVPLAPQDAGPGTQAAAEDDAEPTGIGAPTAAAGGDPPPLYPVQLPAAANLRYALHYYGRSGEALLSWRPSGGAYVLQLQGLPEALAGGLAAPQPPGREDRRPPWRPLIEQASQGQLDANGLAPERFTDRRRGRGQRAANFRRELGRIEFSGPATVQPAWPGAQDRLSWWVQLPAIVAAAAAVPAEIRLFVVDARGRGELWRFDHLGLVAGPAGMGGAAAQHWRHEPAQPEGQRVELWLDPARGHWPVQLRLTSLRTGERFELQLLAIDPPPP